MMKPSATAWSPSPIKYSSYHFCINQYLYFCPPLQDLYLDLVALLVLEAQRVNVLLQQEGEEGVYEGEDEEVHSEEDACYS